jgi:hypothetical protein
VAVIFIGGVAGMIVTSIADNDGAAVTFGLVCAAAAVCLIAITSVSAADTDGSVGFDEQTAADLETRIGRLVEAGADDAEVRDLVRLAVRLGKTAR